MSLPDTAAITGLPFDDVKAVLRHFPNRNIEAETEARTRFENCAVDDLPLGSLVKFGPWLAGWKGTHQPRLERIELSLYAALAGVASQEQIDAARERLTLLAAGGHPVNIMCLRHGIGLKAYDLAVDVPLKDYRVEPALSEEDCAATMAFGMEAILNEPDLLCLGRFGSGGEGAASAVAALLYPDIAEDLLSVLDAGTRADAEAGIARHKDATADPFEILRCIGSRDMAAIVGAILAARTQTVPVILDGFVALVAAAILHRVSDDNITHCVVATPGNHAQTKLAGALGIEIVTGESASGEGLGAVLAATVLRASADVTAHLVTHADVAAAG